MMEFARCLEVRGIEIASLIHDKDRVTVAAPRRLGAAGVEESTVTRAPEETVLVDVDPVCFPLLLSETADGVRPENVPWMVTLGLIPVLVQHRLALVPLHGVRRRDSRDAPFQV